MNNPVTWCLAYLCNKYLSGFIQELSTEQVLVSLLKGDIKLGDLELTPMRFPELKLELTRGQIKSFRLSIPWHKVLMGDSCVISLEISNISLELRKLVNVSDPFEDPEEMKAKILKAFEEKIRNKRSSFNKLLEVLSNRLLNIEVIEFILSRLEIHLSGLHLSLKSVADKQAALDFNISDMKILPTDSEFSPFPDKTSSLWEKIQGFTNIAMQRPTVTLSESLLQFKLITLDDISISVTNQTKENLMRIKNIHIRYSSKNYLWLGQSDKDTDIHVDAKVGKINFVVSNRNVDDIYNIVDPKIQRMARSRKENWIKARELVLKRVRMKSWLFITRKVLWRSIYKKLYAKYVLKIEPETSNIKREEFSLSSEKQPEGISKYIKYLMPQIEYSVSENKEKPKSSIIPAFHFNVICPVEELELALMADLEKNLEISEILKYRQEEQDRYDYEQFEKAIKNTNMMNSGYGKISNYFKTKAKIVISRPDDSKIVNLIVNAQVKKVDIRMKTVNNFFLNLVIQDISLLEECLFTEPLFRYKQTNYDRKSLTHLKIMSLSVYDLLIKDSKVVKKVLDLHSGVQIDVTHNLKHIYDEGFSESVTKKVSFNIPEFYTFITPGLFTGFNSFFSQILKTTPTKHMREDYLVDLLEPIQDFKINYKHENPLVLNLQVTSSELIIAKSYKKTDPVIKVLLGGVVFKHSSSKQQVDIKNFEAFSAVLDHFTQIRGLYIYTILRTQGIKMTVFENKTEILVGMIQGEVSNDEFLNVSQISQSWIEALKKEEIPQQLIMISLKSRWTELILQRVLSSLIVTIGGIFMQIHASEETLHLIVKNLVYSDAVFFLESNSCISARELTVLNTKTGQILFHMFSDTAPDIILTLPGKIFLYRDTQAAFYYITQTIDKLSAKYKNIISTSEFTFSNFHIGIDLDLLAWLIGLQKSLSEASSSQKLENNSVIISKMIFHGTNFSVNFLNNQKSNYFLMCSDVLVVIDTYPNKSETRLRFISPSLMDTSVESSNHCYIFTPLQEQSIIDVDYLSRTKKDGKVVDSINEIRFTNTKLTFLNRVVMEAYEYFFTDLMGKVSAKPEEDAKYTSSLSILILNSEIWMPRNSAVNDGFTIKFELFKVTNVSVSEFLNDHKFRFEHHEEKRNSKKPAKVYFSGSQENYRKHSMYLTNSCYRSDDLEQVDYIRPELLRYEEGKALYDINVFYYDPDNQHQQVSNERSRKLPTHDESRESELIVQESRFDVVKTFFRTQSSYEKKSSSSDSNNHLKVNENQSFSHSSLKSDSSDAGEKVKLGCDYKITLSGCNLIDTFNNLITTQDFTFTFELDFSSDPWTVKIISANKDFSLRLYQNQYNILLKTLQESFFELYNCRPSNVEPVNKKWLKLFVNFNDLNLSLINSINSSEGYYSKIGELCDIVFNNLTVKVSMFDTGEKKIKIISSNFKIEDRRIGSLYSLDTKPPVAYLHKANSSIEPVYDSEKSSGDSETFSKLMRIHSLQMNPIDIDNKFEVKILMKGRKKISVKFSYAIFIALPDFYSEISAFFQCPYNTSLFPYPENVVFEEDENPAGMLLSLKMSKIHVLLLSSLSKIESTCFLLRFNHFNTEIIWDKDCNIGPGTMTVNVSVNLEGGHLVPAKYGQVFSDFKFFDSIIESYNLNVNYLYLKPFKDSDWATSQINIRSDKNIDLKVNLNFSSVPVLRNILKKLSKSSVKAERLDRRGHIEPLAKPPEPETLKIQISVNLAIYGFYCKLLNDQMQPIFQANIKEILSAYQKERTDEKCEANFIMVLQVDYFNQKLMSWEPMIEEWGLEIQYSIAEGFSVIQISEYNNVLKLNISAALISTISSIWPLLSNLSNSSQNNNPSVEPYVIINLTGYPIDLEINQKGWTSSIQERSNNEEKVVITLEKLNKMNIENSPQILAYEKKTLNITINSSTHENRFRNANQPKFRKVSNIGIDTPDTYFIYLENHSDKFSNENNKTFKLKSREGFMKKDDLKLGRITKIHFDKDELEVDELEQIGQDDEGCLNFLRKKPKFNKRLAKGRPMQTSEKENSAKVAFIIDVQWDQGSSQRFIYIRSSISVVNNLPCFMEFRFNLDSENSDQFSKLAPGGSVSVPLSACGQGYLDLRPSEDFKTCKIIQKINELHEPTSKNLVMSCVDGIFDKELLTRIYYHDKGEIELGFIPLCCEPEVGNDFFFALTVKKTPNTNPVRRFEQQTKESKETEKKRLIGFKKKQLKKNVQNFDKVDEDEKNDEEFQLDSTSDETEIIITSIISFTNALSKVCTLTVWQGEQEDIKENFRDGYKSIILKQGETEHFYHLKFYKENFSLRIGLKGYKDSQVLKIFPLNIDKEQKISITLDKNPKNGYSEVDQKNSSLFLWVRIIEDENRCWRLSVYSPYWIINKTGLTLKYGESKMFQKKKYSNENDSEVSLSDIYSSEGGISMQDHNSKITKIKTLHSKKKHRFTPQTGKRFTEALKNNQNHKEYDEKDWKQISLFSTSKIINKLNVAVNIDGKLSKWSKNFSLTNSGTSGELNIEGHDGRQYDMGVTIAKGQGIFQQTNVITFRPLYLLKNNSKRELSIRQLEVDKRKACWNLPSNSETTVFWYSCKGPKSLSVAAGQSDDGQGITKKWSGGFSISELGEFIIRLSLDGIDDRKKEVFLQVSIISSDPMIIIQFTENETRVPYELQNYTNHQINFHQILSNTSVIQAPERTLPPGTAEVPSTMKYTWDEECSPHSLVIMIGKFTKTIEFDEFKRYAPVKIDQDIWIETVMKKAKRKGKINIKMNKWLKEQHLYVILTEKWLILRLERKDKMINLDTHCTKVVYIDDNCFELKTCTKSIQFRGVASDEILTWYENIDEAVRTKGTSTQLYVNISVELKGVTHVMKFENEDSSKNEKHHQKCNRGVKDGDAVLNPLNFLEKFTFKVDIKEIVFSLVDNTPQERICLFLHEFELIYSKLQNNTFEVTFSVGELKIDNQQANSHIPVILNPYFNNKSAVEKTIYFNIMAERLEELDNINFLKFMIAPLEIKLNESIISNMIDYYNFIQKTFLNTKETNELDLEEQKEQEPDQIGIKSVSRHPSAFLMLDLVGSQYIANKSKDLAIEKRVYIHKLVLGPLEFCVTLDKDNVDPTRSKKSNLIQILADLGLALTSIESTELRLAGFKIENLLQPRSQLIMSMINHYRSQGIRELYKIVGSVELLGNPFALINSLKAGVKEMFYDPAVALIESPTKFGESLLKGSVGLVRHTVHGLFKSVGTLTGGIGRFLTALTLDKKFQTKMRVLKSRRPQNFGEKLKIGFKTISYGFVQGITGLVTAPIEGAKQGGFGGLLKGIGKGIIGTVAKPTAGIVGTVSDAFSGIGNFARKKKNIRNTERSRPPRSFISDRILKPYDEISSMGQFYLARFMKNVTFEKIYVLLEIQYRKKKRALILSSKAIYVIRVYDCHGIAIPRRATISCLIENHFIVVNVNMENTEADATLKEFVSGNKKRLLADLYVAYETENKTSHQVTFNINLRGLDEIDRDGEIARMFNNYVSVKSSS